ncbi:uncharacterized protein [Equus asinus]|uniref:uncharacterized protein isoform X2 n=2 Tax=Equus asinus TaxID=9793 RepID=UPI0038F74672
MKTVSVVSHTEDSFSSQGTTSYSSNFGLPEMCLHLLSSPYPNTPNHQAAAATPFPPHQCHCHRSWRVLIDDSIQPQMLKMRKLKETNHFTDLLQTALLVPNSPGWIKVTKLKLSPRLCLLVATVASIPSDVIHQKRHIQLRFSNHLSNNQRYITIRRRDNPKGELGDMGLNGVLTVAAVLLLVREVSSGF